MRNLYRSLVPSAIACALLAACSHAPKAPPVRVPPRMDLSRFATLGLVDFAARDGGGLGSAATREFLAALQSAQPSFSSLLKRNLGGRHADGPGSPTST